MADQTGCLVEGCERPSRTKGYCSAHYQRLWKHGDPLAGRTAEGEPMRFLDTAIAHRSDECLVWPFCDDGKGYGRISLGGKMQYVHRIVCEVVNGPAPTPKHEAAHLCGQGHAGCINPLHLSWKTRVENEADKIAHGTRARGEDSCLSKLNENQVREIIRLKGTHSLTEIGRKFGVSRTQVWAIQRGERWSWLKGDAA